MFRISDYGFYKFIIVVINQIFDEDGLVLQVIFEMVFFNSVDK